MDSRTGMLMPRSGTPLRVVQAPKRSVTLSSFQLGTGVCSLDCSLRGIIHGVEFRSTFHSLGGVGHYDRYVPPYDSLICLEVMPKDEDQKLGRP